MLPRAGKYPSGYISVERGRGWALRCEELLPLHGRPGPWGKIRPHGSVGRRITMSFDSWWIEHRKSFYWTLLIIFLAGTIVSSSTRLLPSCEFQAYCAWWRSQ
jgi:hypothetical protein